MSSSECASVAAVRASSHDRRPSFDWVTRARGDRTKGRTGVTSAERERLARLRKENRILQEERDIFQRLFGESCG